MAATPTKPDPYCAFKDDRERCKALGYRDLRYVAIAVILCIAVATGSIPLGAATLVPVTNWLLKHLRR